MGSLFKYINVIASVIQATAAGIAIYLFFSKLDKIKSIFNLLVNYSFQTTLSGLKAKFEKLIDHNADDLEQQHAVSCVLNDIRTN